MRAAPLRPGLSCLKPRQYSRKETNTPCVQALTLIRRADVSRLWSLTYAYFLPRQHSVPIVQPRYGRHPQIPSRHEPESSSTETLVVIGNDTASCRRAV